MKACKKCVFCEGEDHHWVGHSIDLESASDEDKAYWADVIEAGEHLAFLACKHCPAWKPME